VRQITRTITPAAALIAALGLGGCVADKPAARPIQPPEQLRPDLIVIGVQPLLDDDNNGYPDTIPLIVYIWDERYPLPLWVDGSMHFEMLDESGGAHGGMGGPRRGRPGQPPQGPGRGGPPHGARYP
jgi:hypothetical protein